MQEKKTENEQRAWELWLHKVFDKSFNEFMGTIQSEEDMRKKIIETVDVKKAANVAMDTIHILGGGAA